VGAFHWGPWICGQALCGAEVRPLSFLELFSVLYLCASGKEGGTGRRRADEEPSVVIA